MAPFASLGMKTFKIYAGYMLDAGVPPEELKETVYLVTVPAGSPRAIEAAQVLHQLLAERGLTDEARAQSCR